MINSPDDSNPRTNRINKGSKRQCCLNRALSRIKSSLFRGGIILILMVFTIGCGNQNKDDLQWSGKISEQSERFIISYNESKYSDQLERIEGWWVDVQECTGVSFDISDRPLIIEYIDAPEIKLGFIGWITPAKNITHVIQIDLSGVNAGQTTRHEMLHYLLYIMGVSNHINLYTHSHPFFNTCGWIVHP